MGYIHALEREKRVGDILVVHNLLLYLDHILKFSKTNRECINFFKGKIMHHTYECNLLLSNFIWIFYFLKKLHMNIIELMKEIFRGMLVCPVKDPTIVSCYK